MSLILSLGYTNAQMPTTGTAGNPTWYYIQVKGSGDNREDRVFTAETDEKGTERVKGKAMNPRNVDNQLWRFEESGGNYTIVSKGYNGKQMDLKAGIENGQNTEKLDATVLSATPDVVWTITANNAHTGYYNIQSVSGSMNLPLHLTNNWGNRDYPVMGYNDTNDANSVFRFVGFTAPLTVIPLNTASLSFGKQAQGGFYSEYLAVIKLKTVTETITFNQPEGFTIKSQSVDKDIVEIEVVFNPTEAKDYNSSLVITAGSNSQTVNLTGTGVAAPKMSNANNEYWYVIQFDRQAGKAIQENGDYDELTQTAYTAGSPTAQQLWKLVGTPDNFKMVSYFGNETGIFADKTRASQNTGFSNNYSLSLYQGQNDFQIYNKDKNAANGYRYLNDQGGSSVTQYAINDGGNKIRFTPVANPTVGGLSVRSGSTYSTLYFQKSRRVREISVIGRNLNDDISFSTSGAFSVQPKAGKWNNRTGGTLIVSAANAAEKETGTLTVTAGSTTKTIPLLVLTTNISTRNKDYWYYIQYNRDASNYMQDMGANQNIETGTSFTGDPAQKWKIADTDIPDLYRIVNASGRELGENGGNLSAVTPTASTQLYFNFTKNNDGNLQLYCREKAGHVNKRNSPDKTFTFYGDYANTGDGGNAMWFNAVDTEWTGAADSEWTNNANWTNGVPGASSGATIPNVAVKPALSGNAAILNLVMNDGAEIELNTHTLTVTGTVKAEKKIEKDNKGQIRWYPIGFPFEPDGVYCFTADKTYDYPTNPKLVTPVDNAGDYDFWLRSLNETTVSFTSEGTGALSKGIGYIAKYPSYFVGHPVTYVSQTGKAISKGNIGASNGKYKLTANPTLSTYQLTDGSPANVYYYTYNADNNNFNRIKGTASVKPFESFIAVSTTNPGALKSSVDNGDGMTGLNDFEISDVVSTQYYNLQGIRINEPEESGVYIVKQILKSGKEVTKKTVKTIK
jgi:hypothetical protein